MLAEVSPTCLSFTTLPQPRLWDYDESVRLRRTSAETLPAAIICCNCSFRDLRLFPFDSAKEAVIRLYGVDSP